MFINDYFDFSLVSIHADAAADVSIENIHRCAFSPSGNFAEGHDHGGLNWGIADVDADADIDVNVDADTDINACQGQCHINYFTLQCILGLLTGLMMVKALYKSPSWLHSSRLDGHYAIPIIKIMLLITLILITTITTLSFKDNHNRNHNHSHHHVIILIITSLAS